MLDAETYCRLVEGLEQNETPQPQEFFALLKRHLPVGNCAYVDAAMLDGGFAIHRLHHCFPPAWERAYLENGYYRIDPVLQAAMRSVAPVDWATACAASPFGPAFLDLARQNGVGGDGVTIPLVCRDGRTVLFCTEAAVPAALWPACRRAILRDLQALATSFNASMQASPALSPSPPRARLTDREAEVLRWIAAGKSYWEIAIILGISERTVRFFMTNVRGKLDAVSNSQAVARAMVERLVVAG